jgi:hypothetical protein
VTADGSGTEAIAFQRATRPWTVEKTPWGVLAAISQLTIGEAAAIKLLK